MTTAAYIVTEMTPAQIDRAFPLASAVQADCDLSRWRQSCQTIIAASQAPWASDRLFVCANAAGYLKGLCHTRIQRSGSVTSLDVPLYVVATVVDEEGVQSAFQAHIRAFAAGLDTACPVLQPVP
ncbi:hypothetical protein [Rhizobium sp. SSA_523]|uniref:hypothetical protein n=1 Tax=Rhizobium sp. SSA_523 TaxID=2952477 RepID=UPI00209153AA|nr:hypothetical protein [Rhizobium sp. SSA_523]MCO5731680.1 hypothetical protein [Rhizobium sp. SSA_523]WKC22943.1 hypothetical protein QTJ18_19135 [Rhizobium sp. SSA_523]